MLLSPKLTLTETCKQVVTQYGVRKTKVQKEHFRNYIKSELESQGWEVCIEKSGKFVESNNIIVGNLETASTVLTAHYDTPARLPFPNFIVPKNLLLFLLYQLFIVFILLVMGVVLFVSLLFLNVNTLLILLLIWAFICAFLYLLVAGPANPSNANDNTSGVLVLLETALALSPQEQKNVAFVFFDNEELGMVGSSQFVSKHGKLKDKLLLNFDCVGVGDTFLFVQNKECRNDTALQNKLPLHFVSTKSKNYSFDTSPFTIFPSDQMLFHRAIGIGCFKNSPLVGLYITNVHTKKDTLLETENILTLRNSLLHMLT